MLDRTPPTYGDFNTTPIGFKEPAEAAARSFAERWNAGVYEQNLQNASSCSWVAPLPSRKEIVQDPQPRRCPQTDLTLFQAARPLTPTTKWTTDQIIKHMPRGVAGADGVSTDWLQQCHSTSLDMLCILLDFADDFLARHSGQKRASRSSPSRRTAPLATYDLLPS